MASVNKVIVLGHLGKDPEIRYTPSGSAVASVRIATTRSWKNRESGDRQEETEWHSIVFYDRLAEVIGEYVKKGHPLYVEGRLKTRKWQDKDGHDRYTTEIIGESMQLLASRGAAGEGGEQRQQRSEGQQQRPAQRQQRPQGNQQSKPATGFDDMDDDIPF